MPSSIHMVFQIVAPVFGVALALILMLFINRAQKRRAHQMAWTFIWVNLCLVGALVLGALAAFVAWRGFQDADGRILDGCVVVALLALAVCVVSFSRHRHVGRSARMLRTETETPGTASAVLERRRKALSHPLPPQVDSLAVVTGRYESARELAVHDALARKELVDYLGRQIARREFGDPEARVIDGYILAVFESRPGLSPQE